MTEPQTWTIIGVLTATLLGMMTMITQLVLRTITGQITSLRNEMLSQRGEILTEVGSLRNETTLQITSLRHETNAQITALRTEMELRFQRVDDRLDGLDRDMQAVAKRVFPDNGHHSS
ncbi:hypothetical protein SAMN06309944_2143 [Micrococcales bacterium KH10]|nr:hypothetical protein SAMN06309944_2143 [Micrococcales bacterium KH10]